MRRKREAEDQAKGSTIHCSKRAQHIPVIQVQYSSTSILYKKLVLLSKKKKKEKKQLNLHNLSVTSRKG